MTRHIFIFLFVSFAALEVYAQTSTESYIIAGITVEGNKIADSETIISLSGLKPGDQISYPYDSKLIAAIKNLWKRKQFSDVDIAVDKVTSAGVFLAIRVSEFPRLSEFKIENNKEVNSEEIMKSTGKIRGDIISPYEIYLIKEKIKKKYEEEGLMFAKIDAELIRTDTANFSKLILAINEGVQFHVRSIEFTGNKIFSNSNLAGAFSETHTKHWWEFWRSSKFDMKDYKKDLELLKKFFVSKGFIDADINKDTVIYNEENEIVDIQVQVSEGSKYYIRNIDFKGNTVYPDLYLRKRLDFKTGDEYDITRFDKNMKGNEEQSDIASAYLDNGYLMANLDKQEKRIGSDSIDITVRVLEGERVTIRRVEIEGNNKTKDKVIRRELYTRPGYFFDKSAVIRSIRALGAMQYFSPENLKFDVRPISGSDNTRVDVVYKVDEKSTDTFNASIGFAGTFGLTGSIGFTFNNFSITEPLKGGGGQVFNFNWEFGAGARYQTFSLGFTEPWLFDQPTTVGFVLYDTRITYDYTLRRTGVGMNIGRRFHWPDDYFRGDWGIRLQENDLGNYGNYLPGLNTEITLSQSVSRSNLNSMFFPTVGSRFSLSSSLAMGSIGIGTVDFFKNEIGFDMYNPLLKVGENDRLVLFMGTKVGYVTGLVNDSTITPLEKYSIGGNGLSGIANVTPLRGYQDRVIGPSKGGKILSKYTAELRYAISLDPMPVYLYGFAEAGNVWNDFRNMNPFDLKRAAGVGVQLMINPIGVIGFSYGYGFDADRNGNVSGWNFLFHLGNQ